MQWMQDSIQSNVENLNKVRRDASKHLRNKKKAYMKAKIEELETNSKIKNVRELYRGINDLNKGYQPRTNIVKDEQGDLVVDSHSILARWRNYFSLVLNVHRVIDVRQAEIHTAELLYLSQASLRLSWLLISYKVTNYQVLIKCQQN
jgi:UDP:flavonoid glycosyltransferase YjiC (YdhE family)